MNAVKSLLEESADLDKYILEVFNYREKSFMLLLALHHGDTDTLVVERLVEFSLEESFSTA